jgi:acetate kinase
LKILIINSGSSSLKYTLFQMRDERVLFSGAIDRIGLEGSTHVFKAADEPETTKELSINDHGGALDEMLDTLVAGPLKSLD